jgi:hypothetical protein
VGRTCSTHGAGGKSYRILIRKHEGQRLLGRSRDEEEGSVKMSLKGTG